MHGLRRLSQSALVPLGALLIASWGSASYRYLRNQNQSASAITATPYKSSCIYELGEKSGWKLSAPTGAGKYRFVIKKNNHDLLKSGEVDLSLGSSSIEFVLDEPAMIYMELRPVDGGRTMVYGAAVAPLQLRRTEPRPRDFDSFWRRKVRELKGIPENSVVTPGESYAPEVEYATLQMDHVNGTHVYGQIARPKTGGKHPAVLMLQWASPPYPLQKPWVIELAKQGWLALDIEPHDVRPNGPPAYYQGLPSAIKNYTSIGQDDRDKSYFVEMYLRDYRAVDYLTHCPDWDGKTLLVMGTSMGGQQSLCVAGLHPKITHVIVEVPSGCDLNGGLHGRQQGYPNFPLGDPRAVATAPYVDAVNFARRIRAKTLVGMGFLDTVAPPAGIWTAFNEIRAPKEVAPMPEAPHNNTATREQQKPYTDRATAWMTNLLKSRR